MTVTAVNAVNTDIFYVYLETAGVVCLKLVSKEYCTSLNELCVSVCYCDQNAGHYVGQSGFTPEPRPLKKGTFDTNAAINSECSGDMSSTQYNQI